MLFLQNPASGSWLCPLLQCRSFCLFGSLPHRQCPGPSARSLQAPPSILPAGPPFPHPAAPRPVFMGTSSPRGPSSFTVSIAPQGAALEAQEKEHFREQWECCSDTFPQLHCILWHHGVRPCTLAAAKLGAECWVRLQQRACRVNSLCPRHSWWHLGLPQDPHSCPLLSSRRVLLRFCSWLALSFFVL